MGEVAVPLVVQALLAGAGVVVALRRGGRAAAVHPLLTFGVPYAVITTGPAVRWLVFDVAPYGIHLDVLDRALWIAVAAQAGILAGGMLAGRRVHVPRAILVLAAPRRFRRFALGVFAAAFAAAGAALAARWGDLTTIGKLDAGATGDPWIRLHYAAFLVLLAVVPAVVLVDQAVAGRPLPRRSQLVLGAFALLCLLSSERDVALVLVMIPLAWLTARRGPAARPRRARRGLRTALRLGAGFVVAGVVLVGMEWARSGGALSWSSQLTALGERARQESAVQSLLGLGSNLFVTSRVAEWVPADEPHRFGGTYLATLGNLAPSFLLPGFRFASLPAWFKDNYAPTSTTGYGFGMEAEAYLNFGLGGPVLVFALWTAGLVRLFDGWRLVPDALLHRYAFTFMCPFSLYCIRGDSLMWAKGFCYAVGVVWLLAWAAGARRRVRRAPRPRANPPATAALSGRIAA